MDEEKVIVRAKFNPDVRKYWLLSGVWILLVSVVGIPLLIFWWFLGMYFTGRYLERMECLLTEKSLIVRKGILIRVEKTVPLEKITDLGMVQGPIMRYLSIEKMTIETAGQSAEGALISLTGIVEAGEFRKQVLNQRESLRSGSSPSELPPASTSDVQMVDVLVSIRDSLSRIEKKLGESTGSSER
ncbi:MAG: PH domain-containing protein [Rhodothermia bacterium]|nr:MAG: PH domain-containing protein [Rhodothermia bacterium]